MSRRLFTGRNHQRTFQVTRYSDNMKDQSQLPQELSTAREVILVQSNAIITQKSQIDQLTKEREELRAEKQNCHVRLLPKRDRRTAFVSS